MARLTNRASASAVVRTAGGAAVLGGLLAVPALLSGYGVQVMTIAFYYVMIGISWNLLAGFTGQFSVAQHALATAAAYASAAVVLVLGWPIVAGVAIGTGVAALLGFGLATLTLRTRGIYFALSTWAFAETLRILLAQNYQITRGDNGLPVPFLFGTVNPTPYYYLFLVAASLMVLFSIVLLRTKIGYRMRAIRDDEEIAVVIGINAFRWKRIVFTLSAALAGISGALYGHTIGLLTPGQADFSQMAFVIVAVVLGGYRTIWGPVIGALLAQGLAEALRFSQEFRLVLFAVVVIAIVRFYPPGIVGGLQAIAAWVGKRRARADDTVASRPAAVPDNTEEGTP
jgi:branched-chain amino acid transport system permease protein